MKSIERKNQINGVHEANPYWSKALTLLSYACVERSTGQENLDKAIDLVKSGTPVFAVGNHLSNLDGPLFREVVKRRDRKTGESIVFILGQRLKMNPVTRPLVAGASYINVWPTTIIPEDEKAQVEKEEMNRNALCTARNVLEDGRMLTGFLEGSRSRSGKLQDFQNSACQFALLVPDTHILPFSIVGTEKVLSPVKGKINNFVPHPHPTCISFDEPFKVSDLFDDNISNSRKRKAIAEEARTRVAALLPEKYGGTMTDMKQGVEYVLIGK